MSRCEARTVKGGRCRCKAIEYRKVAYSDGVREFLVCPAHAESIVQGAFRPAADKSPINKEITP